MVMRVGPNCILFLATFLFQLLSTALGLVLAAHASSCCSYELNDEVIDKVI